MRRSRSIARQERTVELVELAGARKVYGFRGLVMGELDTK
jgi:urease beta subunit